MTRFENFSLAQREHSSAGVASERFCAEARSLMHPPMDQIPIKVHPGVSTQFEQRVQSWVNTIPPALQKLAAQRKITFEIIPTANDVPEFIRDARKGCREDALGVSISALYYAGGKKLYLVEQPELTEREQQLLLHIASAKNELTSHGVRDRTRIDIRSDFSTPFERLAWHEFGHAVDLDILGSYSLSSQRFYDAYMLGRKQMSPQEKQYFSYYVHEQPGAYRGHETDRGQQELFAQLFALAHCPDAERNFPGSARFQQIFTQVVDVMRDEIPALIGYELKSHPNRTHK